MARQGFFASIVGKPAPSGRPLTLGGELGKYTSKEPNNASDVESFPNVTFKDTWEKYPSKRADSVSDIERFPNVTFGDTKVHLQMGMHPGVSTLYQMRRQRRGPYI